MKYLIAAFTAACAFTAIPALAQTVPAPSPAASTAPKAPPVPAASAAPAASPAASPSPSPSPKPYVPSGYAATSYNSFSGAASQTFANGVNSRVFDLYNRQPMLNALNVQLQKNGTLGGKLELTAGTNANVIASFPENTDSFDITQAYLAYTSGMFTLQAGKFETLAGAEVIEDPANSNASRSILFGYAVPFTHTGARLTYAPSSLFSVIAGVNNGWDNLKGNGGNGKTAEFGLAYNGSVIAVTAQAYSGTERLTNVPFSDATGKRTLIDVVGTYHTTPKLTLVVNYDHGRQENAPFLDGTGALVNPINPAGTAAWTGVAGYATYQLTPRLSASLRGETFDDAGGYRTGYDQHWHEGTLTLGYAPSSSLLFRLEGRADGSNQPVWLDGLGRARSSLQSVGAQAIVKF